MIEFLFFTGAALEMRTVGFDIVPRIMIPFLCSEFEVDAITSIIAKASDSVCAAKWAESNYSAPYLQPSVGCILETPRACLKAENIAHRNYVDSVVFDLDLLTELMFGMSRDDTGAFMVSRVFVCETVGVCNCVKYTVQIL